MKLDSWILALHLLSAFALAGATTVFSIAMLALRRADGPKPTTVLAPLIRVALPAVVIGTLGTIVFGIWLAISLDDYAVWDGWVIAAIVLWVIGSETGRRSGDLMGEAFKRSEKLLAEGNDGPDPEIAAALRNPRMHLLSWISAATIILVVVDMIWKPGA
jgi:hypothetical protein